MTAFDYVLLFLLVGFMLISMTKGLVREVISKIQTMRKEAGFEVMDHILIYEEGNTKIEEIFNAHKEEIMGEVLAEDITLGKTEGYVKEWNINGENVTLGVAKV